MKQTSLKLLPKIFYGQVHIGLTIDNIVSMILHTLSEKINFSKCIIGNHKNSLIMIIPEINFSKCTIGDHKNSLDTQGQI